MNRLRSVILPPVPVLGLSLQYESLRAELRAAVEKILASQHFILGPEVESLERELAEYCGTCYGVGVASGTDALALALRAAHIRPGDEVLVPAFTYIATADTVSQLGATPVFVDSQPETFCMNPQDLRDRITANTRAIIPVHLFGQPADMAEILAIARSCRLAVIEDNAQSIGARYRGKRTGSLGDFGCLSFFPGMNLGACGDAGMILTNSPEAASRLRSLRVHGATSKAFSVEPGWNSRLDELQAAILRVKLRHLEAWNEARRACAALYHQLLSGTSDIVCPVVGRERDHVYQQYTVRVPHRDRVQRIMRDEFMVPATVYYPYPVHLQPIYAHLGYKSGDLPEAERASTEALSLPIYPEMTEEQVQIVATALIAALRAC